jgi:hypothetical protein
MSVPNLSDEWQQHTKNHDENVDLGHALLSKWCVEVAVDHRLFLWVRCLCHRVHGDVSDRISLRGRLCKMSELTRMCRRRNTKPSRSTK